MADSLTAHSWVTLTCFAIVILFCIYPLQLPLLIPLGRGRTWRVSLDLATTPVLGVLFLLATTSISGQVVADGFVGSPEGIQPFSVVILVFALAYICISIDVTGFFEYVAFKVALRGGSNGKRLFLYLFLLSTVMTIFTSNDVVVLTVTPIVCYLTEDSKTDRTAYLMSTFLACNIASMALYIGNPTNIVVAQAFDINFIQYSAWMILPTAASLAIAYIMCWFVLKSEIPTEIPPPPPDAEYRYRIRRKWGAAIGCCVLLICLTALMVVPIFSHVPVWQLTLPFAVVMIIKDVILDMWVDPKRTSGEIHVANVEKGNQTNQGSAEELVGGQGVSTTDIHETMEMEERRISKSHAEIDGDELPSKMGVDEEVIELRPVASFPPDESASVRSGRFTPKSKSRIDRVLPIVAQITRRLPWDLVPFSFGMFMLCEALSANGWVALLAQAMARTSIGGHMVPIVFLTGIITTVACNIMNNLPMAILFARVFAHPDFASTVQGTIGSAADSDFTINSLRRGGMFALIVGSNLGANLTFIGSLAGLMWSDLLRKRSVIISQGRFFKQCLLITPIVLVGSLAVLIAEFAVQGYYV
ncbi:hypothetical protein PhCBS80983_g03748 [Powellomyces hirtus]|uniref:Citrate transporter-like domain-containing protein n=1 Tax=Powellomyces hirtus TaxID=109895 RepID=A0A507E0M2_9FUNG|nr:hypothetical protein PhCBS80983_g03748 [Powellomyces hirtus]